MHRVTLRQATLKDAKTNHPAKRLYKRLGFEMTGETETHCLMKAWPLDSTGRLGTPSGG